jgi:hypothetical protein
LYVPALAFKIWSPVTHQIVIKSAFMMLPAVQTCHLIHCQGVAYSADVSSKPLSSCSLQYRLVSYNPLFRNSIFRHTFQIFCVIFILFIYVICNSVISLYSLHQCSVDANAEIINTTYWSLSSSDGEVIRCPGCVSAWESSNYHILSVQTSPGALSVS